MLIYLTESIYQSDTEEVLMIDYVITVGCIISISAVIPIFI